MTALVGGCVAGTEATTTTTTTLPPVTTSLALTTTLPPTTTTTMAVTTTTTLAVTTSIELPPFPPGRTELEHGGDAWAVVLAAAEDFDDPALDAAQAAAGAAGYTTGATDCDFGAAEILGMPEGRYATVSVYLRSEADADAALEAFRARGVDGAVGVVQTFCLD